MVYSQIKEVINKKWINHICEEKGCQQRAIVIDGNEKLYRFICATEKTRVIGNTGEVNRYDLCIRNPVKGNQSTEASKFCLQHQENQSAETEEQIESTKIWVKTYGILLIRRHLVVMLHTWRPILEGLTDVYL